MKSSAYELWIYFKSKILQKIQAKAERQEANRNIVRLLREADDYHEELNALFREGA